MKTLLLLLLLFRISERFFIGKPLFHSIILMFKIVKTIINNKKEIKKNKKQKKEKS